LNELYGFSSDSFEQLCRALGIQVLGPGVTAFGDGPDGGREATFKGRIPFPFPPTEQWEGYGVLQAKFKSQIEGTAKDQAWALDQARLELNKWVTARKRQPKPDYFVFCTNVSLSSGAGGGKDKMVRLLSMKKYGLKSSAIWDANQLKVYLDNDSSVRRRFCHFFTPGDLLATYAQHFKLSASGNPEAVLSAYLVKEFLSDEDARLSQAGDRSEDRIRLADVFVDLPSGTEIELDPRAADEDGMTPASLSELLVAGSCKLDPLALAEMNEARKDSAESITGGIAGRFVFLGGPGSGKSTIGQFLAQIHRAALLERRPSHRLEHNVLSLTAAIKQRCIDDSYQWPTTPRYPFRIELNSFAKALSGAATIKVDSLSDYLRRSISRDVPITHLEFRSWLAAYPLLLIFDGLDEVPSSSNRKEVIQAIREFLNEARDVESDLLIVATSRPDGYAGEFDGTEVAHRYLLPLPTGRALRCAQKYVGAKIAPKDERRASNGDTTIRGEKPPHCETHVFPAPSYIYGNSGCREWKTE
jgi:hypothetical protein